jgi:hypothetical protein
MKTWSDWLKAQKAKATADCVLRLSRNITLQDLIVGWRNTPVTFPLQEPLPNLAPEELKKVAWELCQYDITELAARSGLNPLEIPPYLRQAAAIDAIFPDGTLNEMAEKLISAIIAKSIRGATQ